MKRIPFLVPILMILLLNIVYINAVNAQDFTWGISVGDRINYEVDYYQSSIDTDPSATIDFYVENFTLPEIPENVDNYSQVYTDEALLYYANGTQFYDVPWSAIAIGDWDLLTELYNGYAPNDTVMNYKNNWMIIHVVRVVNEGMHTLEMRYSKVDGALNYRLEMYWNTQMNISSSSEIIRDGYVDYPSTPFTITTNSTQSTRSNPTTSLIVDTPPGYSFVDLTLIFSIAVPTTIILIVGGFYTSKRR